MLLTLCLLLAAADAPPSAGAPPAYVIGVEDVLAVHLWKEPEISRRVTVRPDGQISLPLVNDVPAAGLTPARLAAFLSAAFRQHLTEVEVSVIVEEVNSRKFFVTGEVMRPGAYPLAAPTSVLQAISTAGGFREFASTKKIQVLRRAGGARLAFDYGAVVKGRRPDQNVWLEAGDTVVVP